VRNVAPASVLRAIDANLNRAVEGVRVVEDVTRFFNDDAGAARELREIRHGLRAGAGLIPGGEGALLCARDSAGDVARNAPAVTGRADPVSVAMANLKRAQEAARALEEFSKLVSAKAASHFGELRFRLYDIEKEVAAAARTGGAAPPLPGGRFLYAVADYPGLAGGNARFSFLKKLVSAGAGMIQLREKGGDDADILKKAMRVRGKLPAGGPLFVVNDRTDIALAVGADAVHLGQGDLSAEAIRNFAGGRLRTGLSTHSYKQAVKAIEAGSDYISVGPVFSSPTKPDKKPVGLKLLRRVAGEAGKAPVVAIGGVTPENLEEVFDAGASGAAMISALSGAEDVDAALEKIFSIIERFE